MKIEAIPMFNAPTVEVARSEVELQWQQWRNRCPLRRLSPGLKERLALDGWTETVDMLGRGLIIEIPWGLADRMQHYHCGIKSQLDIEKEPLLPAMAEWLAVRPRYPWQAS